ncbi:MAG: hypothetical protein IT384_03040 [Deltaproteobacteria bacterium]|nr:hypothetical protein [Deltaproteobacteria bacterium]
MRLFVALAVSSLTAASCGPLEEATEQVELVERLELAGTWRVDGREVELRPEETKLKIVRLDGGAVTQVPIAHVDLLVCYDGCGRSCRALDDSTRPWFERGYVELLGSLPELTRTGSAAIERLEIFRGLVCARGP